MFVGVDGRMSSTPFWQSLESWTDFEIRALDPSTEYQFRSKARSLLDGETGLGPATTTSTGRQGDVDGDGLVSQTDVSIVQDSLGTQYGQAGFDARADLNGDDRVTFADLIIVQSAVSQNGDFDGDGDVDGDDYALFADCMRGPSGGLASPICQGGDFDVDQDVDLLDAALFQQVFSSSE
jgi:hypothetical protein